MERQEFLKSLGISLAFVCAGNCLSSCGGSKSNDAAPNPTPPAGTTASVDLSTKLLAVGDQSAANGILFIRIATGNAPASFVATEATCPHQGGQLVWQNTANKIQCQLHFAEYKADGSIIQGPQNSAGNTRALKIYPVTVTGSTLSATV